MEGNPPDMGRVFQVAACDMAPPAVSFFSGWRSFRTPTRPPLRGLAGPHVFHSPEFSRNPGRIGLAGIWFLG
jgi:hypothetical protein